MEEIRPEDMRPADEEATIENGIIPDVWWVNFHKRYADALRFDPIDAERHINFRMQDFSYLDREDVEKQHIAWHERTKPIDKFVIRKGK